MAQVCDICGKGPQFGNNISHAHNVSRRRWNVNLQAVKALVNGASKRIRCAPAASRTARSPRRKAGQLILADLAEARTLNSVRHEPRPGTGRVLLVCRALFNILE